MKSCCIWCAYVAKICGYLASEAVPDVVLHAKWEFNYDRTIPLSAQKWHVSTEWSSGYKSDDHMCPGKSRVGSQKPGMWYVNEKVYTKITNSNNNSRRAKPWDNG